MLYVCRKVVTWRHSIACSSSHLRNLKVCCAQKMASDVFIFILQTTWNTTPKNPKSVSPLDHFITHVIIPANTGQIEALEAGVRPGFKTWSHRTQICLWLRIKKRRETRGFTTLLKSAQDTVLWKSKFTSHFNGSKCKFCQKWKMEKSRRVQIDAILFPSLFWPDLKRHQ